MSSVATLNQIHFRVRTDTNAVDSAATWAVGEDVNTSRNVETTFRLRFSVQNTGTAASTTPTVLRVSKNGGAYTAVTTSSGATLGAQSESTASSSADEATTLSNRLTAGTGTAASGTYDETGSTAATITNGNYKEFEFGLIIKTAGAASGNTFDFRLYNNTTAFTTYTQTPRITVVFPNHSCLANDVASASSVSNPALTEIAGGTALLADDVISASSVSQPAVQQVHGILANDVASASSVTSPTASVPLAVTAGNVLGLHPITEGFRVGLQAMTMGVYEGVGDYDDDAEAIFASFTVPPTTARKGLIDDVVVALKAGSIWTKIDVLQMYAAADSQAGKINWKNPGTFNATEVNAPSFTADRGFTGASTKYIDTGFNGTTASSPNFVRDSACIFGFSVTNFNSASGGMVSSIGAGVLIAPRQSDAFFARVNNTASNMTAASTNSIGLWAANRSGSATSQTYKNGASVDTDIGSSLAVANETILVLRGTSNYWLGQIACAGIAGSLNSTEQAALYNAINPYLVAVGAA